MNIAVSRQLRTHVGSCNSCQDREAESVLVVGLETLCFRLCDGCAEELRERLRVFQEPPSGGPHGRSTPGGSPFQQP